jgi:hypothetical protein
MNKHLPIATDECNVCDEEPMQGSILRCSVCKNQFYCVSNHRLYLPDTYRLIYDQSKQCQREDWPKHKFNCSLLPPDGLSPAQFEDRDKLRAEADRVSALLIEWKKAFTGVNEEKSRGKSKLEGGQLPEARPIEGLL